MEILKYILIVLDIIVAFALIVITMAQSKEDAGMSATITGSSSSNFLDKNKGRTKEGKLKKWTIILAVAFVIVSIALSIVYVI